MIFYLMNFNLMLMSMMSMIFSLIYLTNKKIIFIEWLILPTNLYYIKFIMMMDWMTLMFSSIVMMISSMVMIYSKEYMNMEKNKKYFIMILMMFVISMMLMIMSPNMMSIMLGWDGLGLISYCLIIYYQNTSSLNSGMLTLLTNRIGDIMLLIMIFLMMNWGSWNLMNMNFNNFWFKSMLMIMIMTKSAQIPFSIWLPAAMAAPTPVSALVHSSTLVTAGIFLLIRFNNMMMNNKNIKIMIMIIGLMTMLTASLNALMEYDLKKIIAFSTLSQLGLMMMMLSLKMSSFVFFHLISHAMFKSLLFMCSGMIIHYLNNSQDIRSMGSLINETPLVITYLNFSNLSLCGFPFLSGFYSKDLIYEMSFNFKINSLMFMLMYMCISFTLMYTIRLMYYTTLNMNNYYPLNMKNETFMMNLSMLTMFLMSITFGNLINWLNFSSINMNIINLNKKMLIYKSLMLSMTMMFIMKFKYIKLMPMFTLITYMLSNFFFLNKLTNNNNYIYMKISNFINNKNEIMWNKYYNNIMFKTIMNTMFNKINMSFKNKMINFFKMMILIMMLSYLFL